MSIQVVTKDDLCSLEGKVDALSKMVTAIANLATGPFIYTNGTLGATLGVCSRTLQTYRDQGLINYSKVGARIFYRREDVENFMLTHSNALFEGQKKIGSQYKPKLNRHGKQ